VKRMKKPGLILLVLLPAAPALAQSEAEPDSTPRTPRVGHGSKGFEIESADGNYLIQIQPRIQFRYAFPFDNDPATSEQIGGDQHIFKVNRARLKIGGHAFAPWMNYFFEYELGGNALLDFRVMLEKWAGFRLKVGQWKVHYNRERVISSGQQQMADRSLINRFFTIDRQQGVSVYGRAAAGGAADLSYWASVFTGTGRGGRVNDDDDLMWMGRLQWNFLGRELPFSGSDIARSEPTGLVAIAGTTNRSPYTAFSQAGGGQLPGFDEGVAGQYRVNQAQLETAFMASGFSWQSEIHFKRIDDTVNGVVTELAGAYFQTGYFPSGLIDGVPEPLEIAARYSVLDERRSEAIGLRHEYAIAANWFFADHRNKLTAELGIFVDDEPRDTEDADGTRFRLQWDVSF